MPIEIAIQALRQGVCLELAYDGFTRLVEVHAVGVSTAGNDCMQVYQVDGGAVGGERLGWKTMTFDKVIHAAVSGVPSQAPRPGYVQGSKNLTTIYGEI